MEETNQQNNQEVENKEITDNTVRKQPGDQLKPYQFKPGESGNPAGRPKGSRNFSTLFNEAIKKIVTEQKIPITDPEIEMVSRAIIEALKGNYVFYRDIMDRRYGQAKQTIETSGETDINLIKKEVSLYDILIELNLDDATRKRLNKKLLEIADRQGGDTEDSLPDRPASDDRTGDLPAK
jgi:hypothetical protein